MKRPVQSVSVFAGIAALSAGLIWSYTPLSSSHASNPSPVAEERTMTPAGGLPAAGFADEGDVFNPFDARFHAEGSSAERGF